MTPPTTVAIINTTPDVIEMLRVRFERAGFLVVSTYTHHIRDGKVDFEAFIRQHRPRVIVYDLAPPYERNFHLFEHVRAMPIVAGCHFVLSSMNPAHAVKLVGRDDRIFDVVDREEDLGALVQAVREAARARPTQ
jgi:CheY-like chemotaxis protein